MKKIVAMIDGSSYAQSVCDHAAWAAARTGAAVDVVHLLGRREASAAPINLSGSIGLGARTALLEELTELDAQKAKLAHRRGRALLQDAAASIGAGAGAAAGEIAARLLHGELVETLRELEQSADLIVIGKRGEASAFAKLHLGSNLERVVRSSHKAVLVAARAFRPVSRFLIAFDGSASVMKAVGHVARNAAFADLECCLLTVGDDGGQRLRDAVALLREAGYSVEVVNRRGPVESTIAETVVERRFDLLVMGAYGHSRVRNLIIGSTTAEMIRSCKISVLLFH